MKRTKQDKQFMIQFDRANRDYLTNAGIFLLTIMLSVTAMMTAVFSIVYTIAGFGLYSFIVLIVFVIVLAPIWHLCIKESKIDFENSKKVNAQLQKELFELYPEYKNKYC